MAVVRYCIISSSTGVCSEVISWDNANTYYPPSGQIIAGDNTGEVGQTYSSGSSPGGTWSGNTAGAAPSGASVDPLDITLGGTSATTAETARDNLGLGTANSPQFTAVELGNASDTTLSRAAAGVVSVEGNRVPSPASQAHGDILYRGSTNWERLAAGTSGQYLKTLGSGAAPAWDTVSSSGALIRAPQVLTSGTSYTTPANCTSIYVEAVGGGGGGGGADAAASTTSEGGGGGGSGAYAAKLFSVSPSTSYTYAIGAGGTAGAATGTDGGSGGNTTFTVGATTLTAGGGGGGQAGLSGGGFGATGDGGAGGTASNGDLNVTGAAGTNGVCSEATSITHGNGGAGGNSFFGGGGQGRAQDGAGFAGSSGGGGGGAANELSTTGSAGGTGGAGLIRIWEFS